MPLKHSILQGFHNGNHPLLFQKGEVLKFSDKSQKGRGFRWFWKKEVGWAKGRWGSCWLLEMSWLVVKVVLKNKGIYSKYRFLYFIVKALFKLIQQVVLKAGTTYFLFIQGQLNIWKHLVVTLRFWYGKLLGYLGA